MPRTRGDEPQSSTPSHYANRPHSVSWPDDRFMLFCKWHRLEDNSGGGRGVYLVVSNQKSATLHPQVWGGLTTWVDQPAPGSASPGRRVLYISKWNRPLTTVPSIRWAEKPRQRLSASATSVLDVRCACLGLSDVKGRCKLDGTRPRRLQRQPSLIPFRVSLPIVDGGT